MGKSGTGAFFTKGEQIGGTNYYYTRDHLGSVREMTNSSGTIVARYDYDPYGRTTLVSGTNLADFQYAGMYMHQPSGEYFTKWRIYDAPTARWNSRDPLGEGSDATLYSYVGNDPIDNTDPLGLRRQNPYGPPGNGCPCGQHPELTLDTKAAAQTASFMTGGSTYGPYVRDTLAVISWIPGVSIIGRGISSTVALESSISLIGTKCVPDH